jgi:hypothetical protein
MEKTSHLKDQRVWRNFIHQWKGSGLKLKVDLLTNQSQVLNGHFHFLKNTYISLNISQLYQYIKILSFQNKV